MNDLLLVVHDTPELPTMPKVFLPRQRLSANPLRTNRGRQVSDGQTPLRLRAFWDSATHFAFEGSYRAKSCQCRWKPWFGWPRWNLETNNFRIINVPKHFNSPRLHQIHELAVIPNV